MDLTVTNTWLAVGAISLMVMAIAVVAAFVVMWRASRVVTDSAVRASAAIERVSQQMSPLAAQTSAFIDDVHELVLQLRHADEVTSAAFERISDRWRRVTAIARSSLWPALAVARSAAAVLQWLGKRKAAGPTADDRNDEERFTYEGGGLPVRSGGR